MQTIAIANQKGGVGKTAVACHLAFYFRDAGKNVLFIDLDPQANGSGTMQSTKTNTSDYTASSLFAGAVSIEATDGVTLIEADPKLTNLERADSGVIKEFVGNVKKAESDFDICIIDTAPTLGLRMTAALIASQYVVSPVEMEGYSIQGIKQMLQTIYGVKQRYNQNLQFLGMLANRFNVRSRDQKDNLEELLRQYGHMMVEAKIGNRSSIAEALAAGQPVWEIKKTAARDAGKEMRAAFEAIEKKMEAGNE